MKLNVLYGISDKFYVQIRTKFMMFGRRFKIVSQSLKKKRILLWHHFVHVFRKSGHLKKLKQVQMKYTNPLGLPSKRWNVS
nr:unnamed protein product [Callosobruchus chinensis]